MDKFIALDIGGVVIGLAPEKCWEALGYRHLSQVPREIGGTLVLLEKGLVGEKECLDIIRRATGGRFSDDEIISAYNSILGDPMDGMLEMLGKITESGFRLAFFSNTSRMHMTHIWKRYEACTLVSGGIFSYEVGAMKPDRKIYEAFEKKFGKPFLYVDDKEDNIRAGIEMGWNSHLFRNTAGFGRVFTELVSSGKN